LFQGRDDGAASMGYEDGDDEFQIPMKRIKQASSGSQKSNTARVPDRKSYSKSQQKIKKHCKTCDHLSSLAAAAHKFQIPMKRIKQLPAQLQSRETSFNPDYTL